MNASRNAAASPTVLSTLVRCRIENRASPMCAATAAGPVAVGGSGYPASRPGRETPIALGTPRRVSSLVSHPMRRSLVSAVRLVGYERDPKFVGPHRDANYP